jgi:holliday junction DNA helicase RuvA
MIAYLEGKITLKSPTFIFLNVNGIGYEIRISLFTFNCIKELENCQLQTHLSIKEDAHTLFGFYDLAEKKTFLDLISVSGVGSSTALAVLSSMSYAEFQQAIINEDLKTVQGIKGIGPKSAQRLILELKDKFKKEALINPSQNAATNQNNQTKQDALAALMALGFVKASAEKTIDLILKQQSNNISTEELIRIALKTA